MNNTSFDNNNIRIETFSCVVNDDRTRFENQEICIHRLFFQCKELKSLKKTEFIKQK
jgi:hypothetical protein